MVSFVTTVCYDVMEGLAISIAFALMTTVFRAQWLVHHWLMYWALINCRPRWHALAQIPGTNDYRDAERYSKLTSSPDTYIFRFDSPLLFTNVERFKKTIKKALDEWETKRLSGGTSIKSILINRGESVDASSTNHIDSSIASISVNYIR